MIVLRRARQLAPPRSGQGLRRRSRISHAAPGESSAVAMMPSFASLEQRAGEGEARDEQRDREADAGDGRPDRERRAT
jgi:hypothetical protein